jgi:hypothetical protein
MEGKLLRPYGYAVDSLSDNRDAGWQTEKNHPPLASKGTDLSDLKYPWRNKTLFRHATGSSVQNRTPLDEL